MLLQCGFTEPALERLPEWLAGARPWRSVELLLHDPDLFSASFTEAYERLRGIRLGWYEDVLPTPWLMGRMRTRAPQSARTRLSLGTAAAISTTATRVRLVERDGTLAFRVPVAIPPSVAAEGHSHIDVEVVGQRVRALLQRDRTYSVLPDVHVELRGLRDSTVIVRMTSPQNTLLFEESVELFSAEDIDLFAPASNGEYRRTPDPWTERAPSGAATLRVADDLVLRGASSSPALPARRCLWQRVEPHEMPSVGVEIVEDITWRFNLDGRGIWHGRVSVEGRDEPWQPGRDLVWEVRVEPPARIKAARLGRRSLRVDGRGTLTLPGARYLPWPFSLHLVLDDRGRHCTVTCAAPPPACWHLLSRSAEGWTEVGVEDIESLARPVRWFKQPGADTPWLFEGHCPVVPLTDSEVLLEPRLAGLGAPLLVEPQRFNAREQPVQLIESLFTRPKVKLETTHDPARLLLSFAWDADYRLEILGEDGHSRALGTEDFAVAPDALTLEVHLERCGRRPDQVLSLAASATLGANDQELREFFGQLTSKPIELVHVVRGRAVDGRAMLPPLEVGPARSPTTEEILALPNIQTLTEQDGEPKLCVSPKDCDDLAAGLSAFRLLRR